MCSAIAAHFRAFFGVEGMRRAVEHTARQWLTLGVALGLLAGCDRLNKLSRGGQADQGAAPAPLAAATPTPNPTPQQEALAGQPAGAAADSLPATQVVSHAEGRAAPGEGAAATGGAPAAAAAVAGKVCPTGMALIQGRFCMDRWEASLQTAAGEAHSPYRSVGAERLEAVSAPGQVPQAYISMNEAKAACDRSGKRLCSTAEFLDACAGNSRRPLRTYPYGSAEEPNACNVDQAGSPTMLLHAGRRKRDSYWMNDPRINQLGGTVAPTGAFEQCVSADGVYDLVGNLLEWTQGDRPLLMGGYYLDSHENGDGCRYVTMRHGADYHDYSTGFRCCSAPIEGAGDEPVASTAEPDAQAPGAAPALAAERPATALVAPPAAAVELATAAKPDAVVDPPGAESGATDEPRASLDPAGFRSFEHPGAKLPPLGPRATYASADAACPSDMALVEGERCSVPIQSCKYWVDDPGMPNRSCGEFEPSVCKGAKTEMRYCIDRYEYTPPSYTHPIVNVSWGEAQMMCGKLGKRLCYEPEWEFACEGPEALPYPYGYKRDGAACNHDRADLFTQRGKLNDQRVPGDSLPECESPFGVFNIVGNVDEWTSRGGGGRRSVLRGGWWLKGRNRCRAATGSHGENYAGAQTGFRCCMAAR